jgi:hypothetical protein
MFQSIESGDIGMGRRCRAEFVQRDGVLAMLNSHRTGMVDMN